MIEEFRKNQEYFVHESKGTYLIITKYPAGNGIGRLDMNKLRQEWEKEL